MEKFKTPSPLSLTINPSDSWCSWEQSIQRYIAASEEKDEQEKIDSLKVSNVEQLLPENLHIKEEPEMLSEGEEEKELCFQKERNSAACPVKCEANDEEEKPQVSQLHWRQLTETNIKEEPEMLSEVQEEKQLCFQKEINSAALPVKNEDEEEKPQVSQIHWRQQTEINIKEEPSTCTINEFMKRQTMGINSKGPEAAQNPDPSSLVLQGPDGTETDSSQTEDSNKDDEDCWQKPQSEAETDLDSTRKKRKMSDSSKKATMGCKASKTQISSCQQFCSKRQVYVRMAPKCVGSKTSGSTVSELKINSGEKPFKCDVCSKCFIHKSRLKEHLKIHSEEKTFKCDVCSKCFFRKYHLKVHMRIHSGEKPFKCDVCNKCFVQKCVLDRHLRIHSEEKQFKCDVCSKCFIEKCDLDRHLRIHSNEKPFKCDVCCKCFIQKAYLDKHMRIHSREKSFKCHVCSECFLRKSDLKVHMRLHSAEKPFKCDVCSKCFILKSYLDKHMRIHSREKSFKCHVCSECFIRKSDLDKHTRLHSGKKLFKCDVCSKSFIWKADLDKHMRIHTGEKPFKCEVCSKCFTQISHLNSHMRHFTGKAHL